MYYIIIIIIIIVLLSTENYTTPYDDQKYGRKRLDRKYGTIPLSAISRHKKNNN